MFPIRLYRSALLGLASIPALRRLAERYGPQLGVGRFVAGDTLDDALVVRRRLAADGRSVILDVLGEFVATRAAAHRATEVIVDTLSALGAEDPPRTLSVKPTQLGLGVDADTALSNGLRVAEAATHHGAAVCLDMESSDYVDATLELFRALRGGGHHHVSTVLQAYLYRTPADLEALLELRPRPTLRLVKGAYLESATVAHPSRAAVDTAYRRMAFRALEAGGRVGVATHDLSIVREVEAFARGAGLGPDRVEFQMLYGVRPGLQRELVERGHHVAVYVPFGSDWYGYYTRRLAERPANLLFLVRSLLGDHSHK